MRGYRGFFREFSRTGTFRALALQLRTGVLHVARQALGRTESDPVERFLENYGPDGVRPPAARDEDLRLRSEACLVCGLCSAECARVGGRPAIEPRDAVIAAARLEVDLLRFELGGAFEGLCASCRACDTVCPAGIPIHRVQARLASLKGLSWPAAERGGPQDH